MGKTQNWKITDFYSFRQIVKRGTMFVICFVYVVKRLEHLIKMDMALYKSYVLLLYYMFVIVTVILGTSYLLSALKGIREISRKNFWIICLLICYIYASSPKRKILCFILLGLYDITEHTRKPLIGMLHTDN